MSEKPTLDALRREIDRIDDAIHELLCRRTEVVEGVRDLKRGEPVKIRPGREDDIIRRLVATHRGNFPKRPMTRIWRELITATLVFEGPFTVAVHAPDGQTGCWDLARDHFGSFTPMTALPSMQAVIERVRSGAASVGVLPFPRPYDRENWWLDLIDPDPEAPRVIARVPVVEQSNARGPVRAALAICPMRREHHDDDRHLLAIQTRDVPKDARLAEALRARGVAADVLDSRHQPDPAGMHFYLIEVDGSVSPEDPRLRALEADLDIDIERIDHLGSFGRPLTAAELDPPANITNR